jgi:RNA polymerase sigma-70 factor, ECF subfamily
LEAVRHLHTRYRTGRALQGSSFARRTSVAHLLNGRHLPVCNNQVVPDAGLDPAVMERFRAGDDDAVRVLYRQYGRLVFTVALRILGNRQLAEDATQQTFLQAWRAASSFDSDKDPAPWLATITRRVAIDMQRSEARRPSTSIEVASADEPALVSLPPSAESVWETWQVREAIDSLQPDEREVVRLQHIEGHSQSEIAERLGVALGTVKSRSHRAHQHLATRLKHLREPMDDG